MMVADDDDGDDNRITLAQQIFGRAAGIAARKAPAPKTGDPPEKASPAAVRDSQAEVVSTPAAAKPPAAEVNAVQPKERKTAAELAGMIELDLTRHPDCPAAGFRVTVYGGSHWRAMLTITPAAGGIRNPREWRELTDELAERLRARYDLARE
jgi:hypothetical protein